MRAARPDEGTDEDFTMLKDKGITTILDLRSQTEIMKGSLTVDSHFPRCSCAEDTDSTGQHRHYIVSWTDSNALKLSLFWRASLYTQMQTIWYTMVYDRAVAKAKVRKLISKEIANPLGLLGCYKDLVVYCGEAIQQSLKLLSKPENAGALICCNLGKDRTGILVALLLHICGWSKEEICVDYAHTQEQIDASERMTHRAKTEFLAEFLTDPSFPTAEYSTMSDLIDFIVNKYGSMDQYLDSIQFNESCSEKN